MCPVCDNNKLNSNSELISLKLISSASSGKTINRSVECLAYYGGQLAGICAIFSAIDSYNNIPIKAMFKASDVPNYFTSSFADCPLCKANQRVDAVITSFGYSKI